MLQAEKPLLPLHEQLCLNSRAPILSLRSLVPFQSLLYNDQSSVGASQKSLSPAGHRGAWAAQSNSWFQLRLWPQELHSAGNLLEIVSLPLPPILLSKINRKILK